MATILDRIVDDTRDIVRERRRRVPLSELESRPHYARGCMSLAQALRPAMQSASSLDATPRCAIIAEAKRASPSKGVIREDYDVAAIAEAYQAAGAAAMSVLTEPRHFQGALEHLEQARFVSIPLLRKDFIVDPYQITEARAWGADAVLLIATILERDQAAELVAAARQSGLSVLMELYDIRELDKLDVDALDIVGVNSRDLNTFEVNLPRAMDALASLPEHIVRVAESGIQSPDDIRMLAEHGIDAALIGETFMRATDPGSLAATFVQA
ncbi:MAG: indole-3-glycerol phosphate synthase [Bacteroidetes bacterium CG12_big_fil_rev_8_21_14_0_65_60_17]|nr:MAG: indole-3-glycerol phosphate synthase [Bacteroidetes bacterium CG12_big_fil_rev_8_21_14_0_65_60_17]